jgi:hypothetical protein
VAWTRLSVYCPSFADYENFSPKEKKEIPKGNDQKSESKGELLLLLLFSFEPLYSLFFMHFPLIAMKISQFGDSYC